VIEHEGLLCAIRNNEISRLEARTNTALMKCQRMDRLKLLKTGTSLFNSLPFAIVASKKDCQEKDLLFDEFMRAQTGNTSTLRAKQRKLSPLSPAQGSFDGIPLSMIMHIQTGTTRTNSFHWFSFPRHILGARRATTTNSSHSFCPPGSSLWDVCSHYREIDTLLHLPYLMS